MTINVRRCMLLAAFVFIGATPILLAHEIEDGKQKQVDAVLVEARFVEEGALNGPGTVLSSPKVVVRAGETGTMKMVVPKEVHGENVEVGISLEVTPKIREGTTELSVVSTMTDLLKLGGGEEDSAGDTPPTITAVRTIVSRCNVILFDDGDFVGLPVAKRDGVVITMQLRAKITAVPPSI